MDSQIANTNMVLQQIKPWEVLNQELLQFIQSLPREDFFPSEYRELAYADTDIPLGYGEFSFTPKLEARILQSLDVQKDHSILEVGTGCGYLTALLARLGKQIISFDIHEEFSENCRATLKHHQIYNAALITDDYFSCKDKTCATYDIIVIGGGVHREQQLPLEKLNDDGKLFCFLGQASCMQGLLFSRQGNTLQKQCLFETSMPYLQNIEQNKIFKF